MITCLSRKNQQQSFSHMCIASETTVWIQGSSRSSSIRGHSISLHEEHHQTCLRVYGYALSAWEEPKTSYVKLANSKPLRPQYMNSVGHPPLGGINIKSTLCIKKYLQVWLKWWWKYSGIIHMLLKHMDGDEQDILRKQKRSKWNRWCYTTKQLEVHLQSEVKTTLVLLIVQYIKLPSRASGGTRLQISLRASLQVEARLVEKGLPLRAIRVCCNSCCMLTVRNPLVHAKHNVFLQNGSMEEWKEAGWLNDRREMFRMEEWNSPFWLL